MSTDYSIGCPVCRDYVHLGQRMASKWSFGYASHDEKGRRQVWQYIETHSTCGAPLLVQITDLFHPGWARVDLDSLEPIGEEASS